MHVIPLLMWVAAWQLLSTRTTSSYGMLSNCTARRYTTVTIVITLRALQDVHGMCANPGGHLSQMATWRIGACSRGRGCSMVAFCGCYTEKAAQAQQHPGPGIKTTFNPAKDNRKKQCRPTETFCGCHTSSAEGAAELNEARSRWS